MWTTTTLKTSSNRSTPTATPPPTSSGASSAARTSRTRTCHSPRGLWCTLIGKVSASNSGIFLIKTHQTRVTPGRLAGAAVRDGLEGGPTDRGPPLRAVGRVARADPVDLVDGSGDF